MTFVYNTMPYRILPLFFILASGLSGFSQFNLGYEYLNIVPVINGDDTLTNAWAGGMNNPQFSELEINMDSLSDLYVWERDGATSKGFVYDPITDQYRWRPKTERSIPKPLTTFAFCRDYDLDGKQDLFTVNKLAYGLDVYRNISDTSLKFEKVGDKLKYRKPGSGQLFFTFSTVDLPAIDDIDGDGDMDIMFMGQKNGISGLIHLVLNQSVENYGVPDSLHYELVNECWGEVRENPVAPGWYPFDCSTRVATSVRHDLHGASTLTSLDLNGDGLKDLITGEALYAHNITLINTADNVWAEVDTADSDYFFPSYDTPVNIPTLIGNYLIDTDHDGKDDLIAAPAQVSLGTTLTSDTSVNINPDWHYRNVGTNTTPDFQLSDQGYLGATMVDVGSHSTPVFQDVTGDGLPDMIVANAGYLIFGANTTARLWLYENVGAAGDPAFELINDDYASLSQFGWAIIHPTFGDLDGDGDADLIIGDEEGYVHLFENEPISNTSVFSLSAGQFENIDVGLRAKPQLFDLNTDGLLDLVIGERYGTIKYFENSGTPQSPSFTSAPSINQLGGINLNSCCGGLVGPFFTRDYDTVSKLYLFATTPSGTINMYGPISSIVQPFPLLDSIVVNGDEPSIFGMDILGDSRLEFLIGQKTGGVYMMGQDKVITPGLSRVDQAAPSLKVFPNPASERITILHSGIAAGNVSGYSILDIFGRVIRTANGSATQIEISSLEAGTYILRASTKTGFYTARFIKK